MKTWLMIMIVPLAVVCGACAGSFGSDDGRRGDEDQDERDGNEDDTDDQEDEGPTGVVTRCLGPSCPRGECGFGDDCSAYDGFDALDLQAVCAGAVGSRELCLQYEVARPDGTIEIFDEATDCSAATVVQRTCVAGCGYNYAPDDCVTCNEDAEGCTFD
jgi:hypothetical protein